MVEWVTIGDARLACGDAREILPEIANVDMVFTDPPYGHNNNNNGDLIHRWEAALGRGPVREARPIANDGTDAGELARWLFMEAARVLPRGGAICCCGGGGGPDPQFARWSLWMNEVLTFKQMIVWDKGPMGMGWHYRRSYETVLVAERKGGKSRWYDDSHRVENIIRPGAYGIKKIIPRKDQHPTEKPERLPAHFISLHTLPGHTVLDPFMGAGTTGAAAVTMGRAFVGIELDRQFFESACQRIEAAYRKRRDSLFTPEHNQDAHHHDRPTA